MLCRIVLAITFAFSLGAVNAQDCTSGTMSSVIQRTLNELRQEWPLGNVLIVHDFEPADGFKRVHQAGYESLKVFASTGAITITADPRRQQGGGFTWGKY